MLPSQKPLVVDSISESWIRSYQILPEYNYAEQTADIGLLDILMGFLSNLLQEIMPFGGNPNGWVFYVIAAACAALVIYLLARYGVISPMQRSGRKKNVYGVETELQTSKDYDVAIGQAVAENKFRDAVRLLYLRSLADLQEAGLIHWRPEKTDREYILDLTNHATQAPLRESVRLFHSIWYGFATVERNEIDTIRVPFDNLRSIVRRQG